MNYSDVEKIVTELTDKVYDRAAIKFASKDNFSYGVSVSNHTCDVVYEFLYKTMKDEKMLEKLSNNVLKSIVKEQKADDAVRKEYRRKSLKLFQITKGDIPCMCGCGYVEHKTKEEVLCDSLFGQSFICANCVEKIEAEGGSVHKVLMEKESIFKVLGIE